MSNTFNLAARTSYPWIFLAGTVATNAVVYLFAPSPKNIELLVPATGVVAAFVYFLYSQHLQETRLFVELFRQFNGRFDQMNERLNEIVSRKHPSLVTPSDKQVLFDYFNLCAEEYLYFKSGYIEKQVWQSWANGMRYFVKSEDVRRLWQEELQTDSYYGFNLGLLRLES